MGRRTRNSNSGGSTSKVCHGYTMGTNFLNCTCTHQHRTHYGYGYIPHHNFCSVKWVPTKFDAGPLNNIEKLKLKIQKNILMGGGGGGCCSCRSRSRYSHSRCCRRCQCCCSCCSRSCHCSPAIIHTHLLLSALDPPTCLCSHSHSPALVRARRSLPDMLVCTRSRWPPLICAHRLLLAPVLSLVLAPSFVLSVAPAAAPALTVAAMAAAAAGVARMCAPTFPSVCLLVHARRCHPCPPRCRRPHGPSHGICIKYMVSIHTVIILLTF